MVGLDVATRDGEDDIAVVSRVGWAERDRKGVVSADNQSSKFGPGELGVSG